MDRNQDPARREMRRAVETFPKDIWFDNALCMLASAVELGLPRDNLLEVLQRERLTVERLAVRAGLPPACLGECSMRSEPRLGRPPDRRTGVFESDVVEVYLPDFLAKATILEQRVALPSFALHAYGIYRGRLRQIARRERHRGKLIVHAESDGRSHIECTTVTSQGDTTVVASPAMAAWIPSPEDRLREHVLRDALREELDPLDFQIADLFMQGLIHQGDKCEIARLMEVSPSRVTAAIDRIRHVLRSLGFCR